MGIGIACVQVRATGQGGSWWVQGTQSGWWQWPTYASSAPQVFGMIFTCCLYKSLKLEHY